VHAVASFRAGAAKGWGTRAKPTLREGLNKSETLIGRRYEGSSRQQRKGSSRRINELRAARHFDLCFIRRCNKAISFLSSSLSFPLLLSLSLSLSHCIRNPSRIPHIWVSVVSFAVEIPLNPHLNPASSPSPRKKAM